MGVVVDVVSALDPFDEVEREHIDDTLRWMAGTEDIFRRVRKPAIPARHLVSYVVVVDPVSGDVFLGDHVKSGLWLPPGGHVEPGEDPRETARRELLEELGVEADFGLVGDVPLFLTVTPTVGEEEHTDVSLWFAVQVPRAFDFRLDRTEFRSGRWWSYAEISEADSNTFDPHLLRFVRKARVVLGG